MSIACAALMCHAPIVVPAIGGVNAERCAPTTKAMREIATQVVQHEPDVIVVVTPHAPRRPRAFGICADAELTGDFLRFGHRELRLLLPGAPEAAATVASLARSAEFETATLDGYDLDHGSMVPLWFIARAGYEGPVLIVSLPYPGASTEGRFGQVLADAARSRGERWAIVASGDMSHRLTPDAPSGYHPRAREFDAAFVRAVRNGELIEAVKPDPELRELAGEDVVQSTAVAVGAIGYEARGLEVFSYACPFGVGYLQAMFYSDRAPETVRRGNTTETILLDIAREAIAHSIAGRSYQPPRLPPPWEAARPVFVTLRRPDGSLRGCIGRTEATLPSLAAEIADCAAAAALRDPRFEPVRPDELAGLSVEISLLEHPEPTHGQDELDPRTYGVVVSSGRRRGVLLPDIEGVDTPEQQLAIAMRKGGIGPCEPHRIERFRVEKIREARA